MSRNDTTEGGPLHLDLDECWALLESQQVGRLALAAAGDVQIFPINYLVDDRRLLFRTSPGTKLVELTLQNRVAFEIDGWDDTTAWSVVVKGSALELDHPSDVRRAQATGLTSWAPDPKSRWVEITPTAVTGRRFARPHITDTTQIWWG